MMPFMVDRIEMFIHMWGKREREFRQVWNENIWVTTSGMFTVNPFACLIRTVKMDRILYSVDYPFSRNEEGVKFMEDAAKSGLVTDEQLEMIAHKNAEKLLGLRIVA